MSLSVPYVLRAAVGTAPQAVLSLPDGELTIAELDRASAEAALALLRSGVAPGTRRRVSATGTAGAVERLAAARIGVVLAAESDHPGEPTTADLRVLEQRVWSETVLVDGAEARDPVTHGQVVRALVDDGPVPEGCPPDLVAITAALLAAGTSVEA